MCAIGSTWTCGPNADLLALRRQIDECEDRRVCRDLPRGAVEAANVAVDYAYYRERYNFYNSYPYNTRWRTTPPATAAMVTPSAPGIKNRRRRGACKLIGKADATFASALLFVAGRLLIGRGAL